ncbi:Molybdenum ABC transporter, periplasmic molybdenum-binding protein ModA [Thermosulfurimonas dismutans]|uniref:Molybdenum ABC transporter, periplasmic molybdenum-binding protein ModA n=1 Tax=Thermosulfurimonas dismutans TaxID=999894 RepID=A0A179D6I6_9BACT|nr:Molybdenum ABC transporter, periplasmic molybdenum-binding protein ModA [Thermosulfurimonas dismutans]
MNKFFKMSIIWGIFLWLLLFLLPSPLQAGEPLRVAAAANLLYPMQEIAQAFRAKTGEEVSLVFNSSGKLLSLIEQGAPFDLFFSADTRRPQYLVRKGVCLSPVTYTRGVLVLWSRYQDICALGWPKALLKVNRLAIADPKLAPYGEAAMVALKNSGLWESISSKVVKAFNISQTFQWAESGNAEAGLVSLSLALSPPGRKGCYLRIETAPLVEQAACVLKKSKQPQQAEAFLRFVLSPEAQAILARYGYAGRP